jgi:selenium-binding protein 1
VRLGGVLDRGSHPSRPQVPLGGGPQRVEISRDGRRIYLTNSFHSAWDNQVYADGIKGWMARITASPEGDMTLDPRFFVALPDGLRGKQVRLQGGDASSDSFCYA